MRNDLEVKEIFSIVSGLYSKAIAEIKLRPEQAFAYVQDEASPLCPSDNIALSVVLQTAIFKDGMSYGVELSRESPYAEDMLADLSKLYDECSIDDLIEIGLRDGELAEFIDLMNVIKKKYLSLA